MRKKKKKKKPTKQGKIRESGEILQKEGTKKDESATTRGRSVFLTIGGEEKGVQGEIKGGIQRRWCLAGGGGGVILSYIVRENKKTTDTTHKESECRDITQGQNSRRGKGISGMRKKGNSGDRAC